jgi:hypothetical protein
MLSVRIRGQNYRISNETLDHVFGDWRRSSVPHLQRRIQDRHDEGKLVVQGQRLRLATRTEEAEQRLRRSEGQEEILRWGLLYLAAQIAEAATEVRAMREALAFDESAATAKLSRDTSELESMLRRLRAEPSDEYVEKVAERVRSALQESASPSQSAPLSGGAARPRRE